MQNPIFEQISNDLKENDVVLYMKGTAEMPMCGFSGTVVMILRKLGVNFKGINVLENEAIREGIKQFTNWPTVPQLYIKGEFIGGCDIIKELFASGELVDILKTNQVKFTAA